MYKVSNQSYGNGVMDIYMPYWSKKPWPTVLSIHGGGWVTGDEDSGPALDHTKRLVDHGFMVVSIGYSLSTGTTNRWPTQYCDVLEAINFLKMGQYRDYIGNIGILGASAGAHIASMITLTSYSMPSVLLYGPYDLVKWDVVDHKIASEYLPKVFSKSSYYNESPINRMPPSSFLKRSLVIHGKSDSYVNYHQSIDFCHALNEKKRGVSELLLVDGADHCLLGGSINPTMDTINERILGFFQETL